MDSLVSVSPEATGVGASPGFRGGVEHPALATVQGDGGEVEVAGGVPVVLMARHTQVRTKVWILGTDETS